MKSASTTATACLMLTFALKGCGSDTAAPPVSSGAGVELQSWVAGLSAPLYLTAPPGDHRLFIVEQGGKIRIATAQVLGARPFLDISDRIARGGERGLLGLAFDPRYASTGRFYVNYTDPNGDTHISRFRVSSDPDLADPASEQVMLTVAQPYANHNGGQVAFGPDGFLWIGLGDGGSGGDPQNRAQNPAELLGSILRLDVSGAGYVPAAGNPFIGQADARPEIWSIGLRNPWRFGFDRQTGDLYVADVGQNEREEIDVATTASGRGRGANFGWSRMEGLACYGAASCDRTGLTLPVLDYDHGAGCSITGGYVYRGAAVAAITGLYFYADYCNGWVRSFRYANGAAIEPREWPSLKPGGQITSFGEDAAGELYVIEQSGTVYRVVAR
ncbi:MAG: PQQ-dependent sugar dehydrogenase [Gemmatimonadales bacterium]|nr:PQQ-dependent sugar dehydrogenase [Gemmatimonadales bacterium]